jgi:hypothetical protein
MVFVKREESMRVAAQRRRLILERLRSGLSRAASASRWVADQLGFAVCRNGRWARQALAGFRASLRLDRYRRA